MKNILLPVVFAFLLFSCSSNKLRDYNFDNYTAAAFMALPPQPQVFTNFRIDFDTGDPVKSLFNLGSTIAKEVNAAEAQKKMDQAMDRVDVGEIIRRRTLSQCSIFMHYRPISNVKKADYVFDLKIKKYGIEAGSWNAQVRLKIDGKVVLRHNKSGVKIWEKNIKEDRPVSPGIFGLDSSADNVLTAAALSKLSVNEIAAGFEHLAKFTADRIAEKLRDDLADEKS